MSRTLRLVLVLTAAAALLAVIRPLSTHRHDQRERRASHATGRMWPVPSSSGVLDHFASDPAHDRLERLVLEDRYAEAFEQAVAELGSRAHRLGPMAPATLASLQWVGAIAFLGGDRRTSEEVFEGLLAVRRRTLAPDDPVLAETLLRLGRVARIHGETGLARRCYAEARRALEVSDRQDILLASLEQAEADLQLRTDLGAAIQGYKRALEIRRHAVMAPEPQLADNLTWVGWILDRLDRSLEASYYLLEARQQLRSLGLSGGTLDATLQQLLADQLAFEGRWAEAEPLYRAAAMRNEALRSHYLGGFARRFGPPDGFEALALAALLRGDGEKAWVLLQKGRAATHRDFAALSLWRNRQPDTFREARALRLELLESTRRLDLVRRLRGVAAWEPETWQLELRTVQQRASLSSLEARYVTGNGLWEPSLEKTRALLDPHTALIGWLEVYVGGAPSIASEPRWSWGYLYILRRSGPIHWIPLWSRRRPPGDETPRADWGPVFARVRRAAEWPLRVDTDPLVTSQLRTWTQHFFDPAFPYLEGIEHLVIEGTRVPIELFRDADGRFVIDRFDVSYTPSAAFLTVLAERPRRTRSGPPRSVLSIAASPASNVHTAQGEILALALMDERRNLRLQRTSFDRSQVSLEQLPRLRFAGIEAGAVARWFPVSTVLQGGTDVERDVRRLAAANRLRDYDVVHVATHTLVDGAPERCGLALAESEPVPPRTDDGVLDAEEILLSWDLDGTLLTLSACESARAAGTWRGEEFGFTPALFAAGARSVLVSLWPVDDRATALLMDRFYQDLTGSYTDRRAGGIGEPLPPARALREAKIYLRSLTDGAGHRPFEHPAYWAGFILIGLADP